MKWSSAIYLMTKILKKPEGKVDELGENFNKETENRKKTQSKLKRKVTEKKTTLEGINGRLEGAEWCSSRRTGWRGARTLAADRKGDLMARGQPQ